MVKLKGKYDLRQWKRYGDTQAINSTRGNSFQHTIKSKITQSLSANKFNIVLAVIVVKIDYN
jgi:hypothetical protein